IIQSVVQQFDCFPRTAVEQAPKSKQPQCRGPQRLLHGSFDDVVEEYAASRGLSRVEVMYCGSDLTVRCVPAETQRELEELGRRDRGSADSGHFGGDVERIQRQLLAGGVRKGKVPGLEFGIVDDLGQSPVHRPAVRWGRVSVYPANQ